MAAGKRASRQRRANAGRPNEDSAGPYGEGQGSVVAVFRQGRRRHPLNGVEIVLAEPLEAGRVEVANGTAFAVDGPDLAETMPGQRRYRKEVGNAPEHAGQVGRQLFVGEGD